MHDLSSQPEERIDHQSNRGQRRGRRERFRADEQAAASSAFIGNSGCPFCGEPSSTVLSEVQYHDTADCNHLLPNITGRLLECQRCGVAFPSHQYRLEVFPQLYDKTLKDIAFLDDSPIQVLRKWYLKAILRRAYTHPLSWLLDTATLRVLQTPRLTRTPRNLRLLDVGCGFGEFLSIYQSLGNERIGTEIIPQLVARLRGPTVRIRRARGDRLRRCQIRGHSPACSVL